MDASFRYFTTCSALIIDVELSAPMQMRLANDTFDLVIAPVFEHEASLHHEKRAEDLRRHIITIITDLNAQIFVASIVW